MTTKPDNIPQDVMDAAELAFLRINTEYIGFDTVPSPIITIARAILKAKNDAYEEAASVADKNANNWSGSRDVETALQEAARDDLAGLIAQAIRNLKHKTEV